MSTEKKIDPSVRMVPWEHGGFCVHKGDTPGGSLCGWFPSWELAAECVRAHDGVPDEKLKLKLLP